jgi:hypothetical protein
VPPKFGLWTFSSPRPRARGDLGQRHHGRAGALGDVDDVAVVVLVPVGQEDVGRLELGGLDVAFGLPVMNGSIRTFTSPT